MQSGSCHTESLALFCGIAWEVMAIVFLMHTMTSLAQSVSFVTVRWH